MDEFSHQFDQTKKSIALKVFLVISKKSFGNQHLMPLSRFLKYLTQVYWNLHRCLPVPWSFQHKASYFSLFGVGGMRSNFSRRTPCFQGPNVLVEKKKKRAEVNHQLIRTLPREVWEKLGCGSFFSYPNEA